MPGQIYKQPSKGRKDDYWPDEPADIQAPSGRPYSRPSASHSADKTLSDIDKVLAENEKSAAAPVGGESEGSALSPKEIGGAEERGLYNPADRGEFDRKPLWTRIKNINKRKKAAAALGAGGIVSLIIAFLTLGPIYRIPALMSGILGKAGSEVQEVVEDRAQRQVLTYILWRYGATPNDYVITDSILGSVYATFRTNRLEDKIFKQTGFKFESAPGKRVRVIHDGRDIGHIKNYDELVELTYKDELTKRDIKKIVKTVVPAWRVHLSSKYAKWLKIKYRVPSYATRPYDKAKSAEENLEAFRRDELKVIADNNINDIDKAFGCLLEDDCEHFNDENKPLQTGVSGEKAHEGSRKQVTEDFQSAAKEATDEVAKTGGSFVDKLTTKLVEKMVGTVAGKAITSSIPFVGQIDLLAVVWHMTGKAMENDLANKIPTIMAGNALGAYYTVWQGYGDSIKAHKMSLPFIEELNNRAKDAYKSVSYNWVFNREAKGVEVETKVHDNVNYPLQEASHRMFQVINWTIMLPLWLWYHSVSQILGVIEDLAGSIVKWIIVASPLDDVFYEAMNKFFGEDWKEKFAAFATTFLMKILGISVDAMATGARMFNQLYTGAELAMNTYCRLNLGCKAISPMKEALARPALGMNNNGGGGRDVITPSQLYAEAKDEKLEMSVLPLKERLFSMDEPNSLANQFWREAPDTGNPGNLLAVAFSQIAKLPGAFLAAFTGTSMAATSTPEQDAEITGVRQYGMTYEERNQEIAPQIRQTVEGECPDVDQETTVNICKADKEIIQSLACWFEACPEYGGQ